MSKNNEVPQKKFCLKCGNIEIFPHLVSQETIKASYTVSRESCLICKESTIKIIYPLKKEQSVEGKPETDISEKEVVKKIFEKKKLSPVDAVVVKRIGAKKS